MFYRLIPSALVAAAFAQQPSQPPSQQSSQQLTPAQIRLGERAPLPRAPLFFREEWKIAPGAGEHPAKQDAFWNPRLELRVYGEAAKEVQALGNLGDPNNPPHVWNGLCTSPTAIALRD